MFFSKHRTIIEKKNDKLGTKYYKTHVHRVISKLVPPPPTWHQILKTIRILAANFEYILYTYTCFMHIPTTYEKYHRTHLIPHPIPFHLSVNLALRASRVNPAPDPEGTLEVLNSPIPNFFTKTHRVLRTLSSVHARHDLNEKSKFWKFGSHRALDALSSRAQ